MIVTSSFRPATSLLLAGSLVLLAAGCGSSDDSSDAGANTTTPTTEPAPATSADPPTTTAAPDPTTAPTTTSAATTTTTEAEATATSAPMTSDATTGADLEPLLFTAEQLGGTFVEDPPDDGEPGFISAAMDENCSEAAAVTTTADNAVERGFTNDDDIQISVSLTPDTAPMGEEAQQTLIDALNQCAFDLPQDDLVHSMVWAAVADTAGDESLRGGLTDTISADGATDAIELNIFFTQVVVGDVTIFIRGRDGFDGETRTKFDPADMTILSDEMVSRVEDLIGS